LRPGRRWGIDGGARTADDIERGGLRRTRGRCPACLWFVFSGGAFAQCWPVGWGQVQGGAEVTIFFLQLCDAMLEGLI
jgi:hypothetical protein